MQVVYTGESEDRMASIEADKDKVYMQISARQWNAENTCGDGNRMWADSPKSSMSIERYRASIEELEQTGKCSLGRIGIFAKDGKICRIDVDGYVMSPPFSGREMKIEEIMA